MKFSEKPFSVLSVWKLSVDWPSANCQDFTILYWQHLVVLGHHQRPEVENQMSVNTQLLPADDGEWFLWKFRNQKMWVLKISIKFCLG